MLQLDSNLAVQFATYLGGAGEEQFAAVTHVVRPDRFVFVGFTTSTQTQFPFPTPNGEFADVTKTGTDSDGLLVALARDRTIPLATYHGIAPGNEVLLAVDADPESFTLDGGEVAIAGYTDGTNFYKRGSDPLGSGRKLIAGLMSATDGSRITSRVRSGNGEDEGLSVVYSYTNSTILVGGRTTSTNFPVSSNAPQLAHGGGQTDGLLVAFEAGGFYASYSTYLGGSGDDAVRSLTVDPAGHVHLAGTTSSPDFPVALATTHPAAQPTYGGGATDGFTGRIRVTGISFGGSGADIATFPTLSYSGGPEEEGYLAAAYRPDGAGASASDPYFAVSAGGRVLSAQASRKRDGSSNEQAVVIAEGTKITGADIGLRIRNRFGTPDPALPLNTVIELEFILFNNSATVATGVNLQATIPEAFVTIGSPEVLPPVGAASLTNGTLSATIGELQVLPPITVRVRGYIQTYPGPSIVVSGGVHSEVADPDPSNNFTEALFAIKQGGFGDDFDLQAGVTIDQLPSGDSPGVAAISVINLGQHIADVVGVRVTRHFTNDQIFDSWTANHTEDTTQQQGEFFTGVKSSILRPQETVSFTLRFRDYGPNGAIHYIQALALRNPYSFGEPASDRNPSNDLAYATYRLGGGISVTAVPFGDTNQNRSLDAGETPVPPGALVTVSDLAGNQATGTTGANGVTLDGLFPGPGAISVFLPDGSSRFYPANLEAGSTVQVPLGPEPPAPSTNPLRLFRGSAERQVWCMWDLIDGTIRTSPDLLNWQSRQTARPPFLLNPDTFGALPPATAGFADLEPPP